MSVSSSSHGRWDRGHEGKDLELSSEVFLVSPAPHDLIGSDIREITVPLQHRDPSRHGIRPTGTLNTPRRVASAPQRTTCWASQRLAVPSGFTLSHNYTRLLRSPLCQTVFLQSWELQDVPCGTTHPLLVELQ